MVLELAVSSLRSMPDKFLLEIWTVNSPAI
ncbi:hypothetical protein PITC_065880 [Penicillium italicum]|uniref:Uncharacterized protein n=1 Tax=Penicillium italicum TaxID=40296 RepID=A0A0A2KSU0_PENIT|nr:hypothetical protein PITC_065880 [Penicillium italicum]